MVPAGRPIKLVIWNLDDARCDVGQMVATLDERGILQSVVGRNESQLQSTLSEYFLCPQLGGGLTSQSIERIANTLDIALRATLLIDNDTANREAVSHALPEVRAIAFNELQHLADDPLMGHSLAELESRPRRLVYLEELARARAEQNFSGSHAEFISELGMQLVIGAATQADLHRLRELVARPNQLCVTYTDEELERLRCSPSHACLLVSLRDRFGDCGQVGLVLMDLAKDRWTLQLFLFSCRVVRRGVDAIVLNFVLRQARAARVRLFAHFKRTSKNEPLWEAYLRASFRPGPALADLIILERELKNIPAQPRGVQLRCECPPQMVERGGPRRLIHAR